VDLPKIVSDLIRASASTIVSIRFPSGDKGQVRGFDGHLVSNEAKLNVPFGRSYWEFGTDSDYKTKAWQDFEKRTREVPVADQRETTFVIVSPWTWDSSKNSNKLEDFVKRCKASSSWKEVIYLDGAALETWLEHLPAVSAWHARNTLRVCPAEGIRCIDEFWEEFVGQFGPALTEEVLVCERKDTAKQLIQDLLVPYNGVSLIADSPDEVLAFTIAAIRKAPTDVRLFLEAKAVIVDSIAAGRQLLPETGLILLLRNEAAKSPKQFSNVGTTVVPLGRQQRGAGIPVLVKPTAYAMGVAMRSMGLEENRALTLARGSGRSLAALARLIPGGAYDLPGWIHQKGQELVPAILAGAWDASNPFDQEIVQQIAGGVPYLQVESYARFFLRDADPPLDSEGTIWKVRAPMDAFVRIGHLIGPREAKYLRQAMLKVFAEIEPEPEPDPDEIVSFSRANPTNYSEWLRDGLATTLLLFAVWSEVAEINLGEESGQEFANRVLSDLPGLRTDPRLLTSLRNQLPILAEAAPDPLLSALEYMLEGAGGDIRQIFNERSGWPHATSEHTGVLWALETLAWDPEYFRRAVMILARLAEIDPGGHLNNRPQNSLAEIFLVWNPNTNASSRERLSVLDEIIRACPAVGWQLLLALLPTVHGASFPTAKPRLREAGADDRTAITYRELWANQAAIAERAIALANHDPDRWMQLVGRIASFAPPERSTATAALDATLSYLDENQRKPLWGKLRDVVIKHERFQSAVWALPEQELASLRSIMEKNAPTDPVLQILEFFDAAALGETFNSSEVRQRRIDILRQLYAEAGPEAIVRLAVEAATPFLVVEATNEAAFSEKEISELLTLSFNRAPDSSVTGSLAGIYRKVAGPKRAEIWLRRVISEKMASSLIVAGLLHAWPDSIDTWNLAYRLGRKVVEAYWTQRRATFFQGSKREFFRLLLMFLRYGRAIEALESSFNRIEEVPSKLILRILNGIIPQINSQGMATNGMVNFYLEKAFEALDRRSDVNEHDIAHYEYKFFPFLEHGSRNFRIFDIMAKDPKLFHFFLRNVYLGQNEQKKEIDAQTEANSRLSYSLLSHFSVTPGLDADGIDSQALATWIDEVRRLGVETDRSDITDVYIGRVLAHVPSDRDGTWPHRAGRAQIERLASDEIEQAIQIERFNMRGVTTRGAYDGGMQERDLAKINYAAAATMASFSTRTAALLRRIGKMWDEEGRRIDKEAALRRLRS
jgi:hypothetical protein